MMDVGVVTRSFRELSNQETAEMITKNGFKWTELCFSQTDSNYWVYNGRSDLADLTDERSTEIVETYRRQGVTVTAIGVFTNLLEPNDTELEHNLAYFERLIQIASINQVPYVSTECGFMPGRRGVQAETYESAFQRLVDSFKWLAAKAEEYNVHVVLEPCVLDVVPSAKRAADFINQVGSDRVRVLLDPANLIANSSEDDMFGYLTPHIAYFHGKDRKVNDAYGRAVGDGDINWRRFLELYHKHTEGVPFILEYVNAGNFCAIRDRVLAMDGGVRSNSALD
ncbi:sugar phosphate isomerase/epimerase family protein [Paenibacillus xerothermodurans]|uniref:Sugar phosphate isomerase/epimerase n=1 Tax=Paenibacillus xerothermodurans TaxID=1977292 RepID=A0A2W1NXD1_PAEXE|nr:sugar phosphate isomerase/epimerase family protein [Paenibacillus xerothermodurans]PZE19518.1 sugar phosphate isomerase/epimerase [Paenibacillus xerothermodurans]